VKILSRGALFYSRLRLCHIFSQMLNLDPTVIPKTLLSAAERRLWPAVLRQAVSAHSSSAKKLRNRSRLLAGASFLIVRVRIQVGPPFLFR
jgi:hypothetical protein